MDVIDNFKFGITVHKKKKKMFQCEIFTTYVSFFCCISKVQNDVRRFGVYIKNFISGSSSGVTSPKTEPNYSVFPFSIFHFRFMFFFLVWGFTDQIIRLVGFRIGLDSPNRKLKIFKDRDWPTNFPFWSQCEPFYVDVMFSLSFIFFIQSDKFIRQFNILYTNYKSQQLS